jgi:hypothetical protein
MIKKLAQGPLTPDLLRMLTNAATWMAGLAICKSIKPDLRVIEGGKAKDE